MLSDVCFASTSAESTTAISGSTFLINIGKLLPDCTASGHTRLFERRKGKMRKDRGYKEERLKIYLYNRYDLLTACLILLSEKF